jgi:CheY-like chemotaxis protein
MEAKKRILVVDDDVDFVQSTQDLLEAYGYEVSSAHSGVAGLQKAIAERPDLMILDVMMATNTEGFEVARKIPETPELRGLPVLMVTGVRREMCLGFKFAPDATWLPVDRLLEKPVDPARLVATIRSLLKDKSGG